VGDADGLTEAVRAQPPDLVIADVRMPPNMTDDGARVARELRAEYASLPILLLSQHIETHRVVDLVAGGEFGYLLKDRVLRVTDFLDAVRRVADGGSALDPAIVGALMAPVHRDDPLLGLSAREREVLALVAEGLSNAAVSARLHVTGPWKPTCGRSSTSYAWPTRTTPTAGSSPSSPT
jgi:DNA-binding NarL/FixJ family response regulator